MAGLPIFEELADRWLELTVIQRLKVIGLIMFVIVPTLIMGLLSRSKTAASSDDTLH